MNLTKIDQITEESIEFNEWADKEEKLVAGEEIAYQFYVNMLSKIFDWAERDLVDSEYIMLGFNNELTRLIATR